MAAGAYEAILIHLFRKHFTPGATSVTFKRTEIADAARAEGVGIPANLGDVPYKYRYRTDFPVAISDQAPAGMVWQLVTASKSEYTFEAVPPTNLDPRPNLAVIKVPDSTPGIIAKHAMTSEQALLAKVRYNRLIDVFTGIVCYSLQNHVRATIRKGVQIETDEVYLGVDRRGVQYVIPVEAKGGADRLSTVQMNQDLELAVERFPGMEIRLVGVQFTANDDICMFLFGANPVGPGVVVLDEKRFRLVEPGDISDAELASYRANLQTP